MGIYVSRVLGDHQGQGEVRCKLCRLMLFGIIIMVPLKGNIRK
jgi:hypothetical protein